jgi:Phosphoenolpyruvate phosphomutase/D-isomer specific 2-hydroxyacid dehydrogenase, NAD binding domain
VSRLRTLLSGPDIVVAPGAPDSVTARLVQAAGFPAVYLTGFGATASRLGTPDVGLLTQTEMTEHARNMTRAVDIPVIADADTGYGGAGLDVFESEPLAAGHPLRSLDNVLLSPHAAWYSEDSEVEIRSKAARNVMDVLQGRIPAYHANPGVVARKGLGLVDAAESLNSADAGA